jgi:hypothetical protein
MAREDRFENALHSTSPIDSLGALARELFAEGYSKVRIVELFEQQLILMQNDATREAQADVVRDVLDFLVGWCSPHRKILHAEKDVSATPPHGPLSCRCDE